MDSRRDERANSQPRIDAAGPVVPMVNPVQNALEHALSSSSLGTSRDGWLGGLPNRLLRQ